MCMWRFGVKERTKLILFLDAHMYLQRRMATKHVATFLHAIGSGWDDRQLCKAIHCVSVWWLAVCETGFSCFERLQHVPKRKYAP